MKLAASVYDKRSEHGGGYLAERRLKQTIDEQKDKISTLDAALKNANESFGENDKRTQNWEILINSAKCLNRREAYRKSGRYIPNELGHHFLEENRPQKSMDVNSVDPFQPFEYKSGNDIGDIVSVFSEDYGIRDVAQGFDIKWL